MFNSDTIFKAEIRKLSIYLQFKSLFEYLFVCPIITQKPEDRFASNSVIKNNIKPAVVNNPFLSLKIFS